MEGLPPGVVPIYPVETAQPFDFRIRTRAGTLVRRVKRMQIPLHPAKCLTTYGAQGLTLPAIIIDICKPPIARNHAQSVYVALSRVRSLYDLAFLRPFTFEDINVGFPADLDSELRRLNKEAFETQVRLAEQAGRAAPLPHAGARRAAESINIDSQPRKRHRTEGTKPMETGQNDSNSQPLDKVQPLFSLRCEVVALLQAPLGSASFDMLL